LHDTQQHHVYLYSCYLPHNVSDIKTPLIFIMHPRNIPFVLCLLTQLIHAQEATRAPRSTPSLFRHDGAPIAFCPEKHSDSPLNCSSAFCGGQDSTRGCKNNSGGGKQCQCQVGTAGAPASKPTNNTTTNAAGSTILGPYQLTTIEKLKSLRQQQTVTISRTTTGSDGQPTIIEVVTVITPGGDALGTASFSSPSRYDGSEILISDRHYR